MATFTVPYLAKTSEETTGGGGQSQSDTITYGNVTAVTMAQYDNTAYLEFDLGQVLRTVVTSISLVRIRESLTGTNGGGSVSINYIISCFVSGVPEIPQQLPNLNNLKTVGGNISVTNDAQASGMITKDITAIFPVASSIGGIMGIKLAGGYPRSGFAIDSNAYLSIEGTPLPALAPSDILPTTAKNPRAAIDFSWAHTPNPRLLLEDPQTASQIEITHPGHSTITQTISGTTNAYTLPAFTFAGQNDHGPYVPGLYRVRTQTHYNGWGAWSNLLTLLLEPTPPQAPELVFPVGQSVNAAAGALLEFNYRSLYDTTPTRFNVLYSIDGASWTSITNTGELSVMTSAIVGQHDVDWQAMAYGELSDPGPWSAVARFYSIGAPPTPEITSVSNSNRPTVYFTAKRLLSWEMEFWQAGALIYRTGNQPYNLDSYQAGEFFVNGAYTVRMRISNTYAYRSDWAYYDFVINTVPPERLPLEIIYNLDYYIRLYFDNPQSKTVYVYRGIIEDINTQATAEKYLRIAKVTGSQWDDYTATPDVNYLYFVRVVNPDYSFADSLPKPGFIRYYETTIAKVSDMPNMLKLLFALGGKPDKGRVYSHEKTFTQLAGRQSPVVQLGNTAARTLAYRFYCSLKERDILEEYAGTLEQLIIRDRRFGTVYGAIDGDISDGPDAEQMTVSFALREVDYDEVVPL
jgi:hypothetical protein